MMNSPAETENHFWSELISVICRDVEMLETQQGSFLFGHAAASIFNSEIKDENEHLVQTLGINFLLCLFFNSFNMMNITSITLTHLRVKIKNAVMSSSSPITLHLCSSHIRHRCTWNSERGDQKPSSIPQLTSRLLRVDWLVGEEHSWCRYLTQTTVIKPSHGPNKVLSCALYPSTQNLFYRHIRTKCLMWTSSSCQITIFINCPHAVCWF